MILYDGSHSRYLGRGTHGLPALGMVEGRRFWAGEGNPAELFVRKQARDALKRGVSLCLDHEALGHLDLFAETDVQIKAAGDEMIRGLDWVWDETQGALNVGLWNRPNFKRNWRTPANYWRMLGRAMWGRNALGKYNSIGVLDRQTVLFPSFYLHVKDTELRWQRKVMTATRACKRLNKRFIPFLWHHKQGEDQPLIDDPRWQRMMRYVLSLHPDGLAFWGMPSQDGKVFEHYLNMAKEFKHV